MNKIIIRTEENNSRKTVIGEIDLEIFTDGAWKKTASLKRNTKTEVSIHFPVADVTGIRFSADKVSCKGTVFIDEVEAYLTK